MRLRTIAGAALVLAAVAGGQVASSAQTRYLSGVRLDAEAHLYEARLGDLPIATQPAGMQGEADPLPPLEEGEVTITRLLEDPDGYGTFEQCLDRCVEWVYWFTGYTHHVMLPVVRR